MTARDTGVTARDTGMAARDTGMAARDAGVTARACGGVARMSAAGATRTATGESVDCSATAAERDGAGHDDGSVQLDTPHDIYLFALLVPTSRRCSRAGKPARKYCSDIDADGARVRNYALRQRSCFIKGGVRRGPPAAEDSECRNRG
jgi:hypothetical protein